MRSARSCRSIRKKPRSIARGARWASVPAPARWPMSTPRSMRWPGSRKARDRSTTDGATTSRRRSHYRPAAWDRARSSAAGKLHPVEACRPLQRVLDRHPESVLICDGGEFGQWAQACLHAPHRVINGVAGSIGSALPFALAARLAKPDAPVARLAGRRHVRLSHGGDRHGASLRAALRRRGGQRRALERRIPDPAAALRAGSL